MKSTDRRPIQDPAGILQRVPELKLLCEHPAVRQAVEHGDPFRLYRTLFWARWLGRLRSQRKTIDALLSQRRLFARPVKGKLWLGTFNGFGATLLGNSEPDPHDGTHIATHCFVALFVIPLLPLGAYAVLASPDNQGMRRQWAVFARVPLGPLPWLWSRALALGVIALVLFGALQAFRDSRYQTLRLINGFDRPLHVEVAGMKQTVPPHKMTSLPFVPIGHQKARALSEEGDEVDALELDVGSGLDVLAWNIGGAAPVYQERVTYSASKEEAHGSYKPDIFCGRKLISLRHVDYPFREPPSSLELSDSGSSVTRTHVDVLSRDDAPAPLCLALLASEDRYAEAAQFMEASARLAHWAKEPTARALNLEMLSNPQEALRLAKAAIQARPGELEFHRIYQWIADRMGQHPALLEEYRARAAAQPDSASAQYLYARLQTRREARAVMEQLGQRFPQEPAILRSIVYGRWLAGDWAGTLRGWQALEEAHPEDTGSVVEAKATALVALGRRGEALEFLKKRFFEGNRDERGDTAELYARIARAEKGVDADELIAALEKDSKLWRLRARAGLSTEGAEDLSPGMRFMPVVARDPHEALSQITQLSQADLRQLTQEVWALAYGEAVRTGAEDAAKALERSYVLDTVSQEVFRRFVRGEPASLDEADLTHELRAAACFVRSRNKTLSAEEQQRLVAQARREDLLQGTITEAITSWPQ